MRRVEEVARPQLRGDDPYELIDARGAAGFLGCCVKTVYKMFQDGRLTYARVGNEYRTTRHAIVRDLGLGD